MKKVGRRGRPKGSTNKKKCCATSAMQVAPVVNTGVTNSAEKTVDASSPAAFELAVRFSGVVQDVAKIAQGLNQAISGMNEMGAAISRDIQNLSQRVTNLEQAISMQQAEKASTENLKTDTPKQTNLKLAAKAVGIPVVQEQSLKDII